MDKILKSKIKKDSKLYGLVLAGGKSKRMGHDKGKIDWYGKEQQYFMSDLLEKFCEKTFISCRKDQVESIDKKYKTIGDSYNDLGQYGGILSAMSKYNDASFLVVACDLPLVDEKTLAQLTNARDTKKIATAFVNEQNNLPEPLIAIWEGTSRNILLEYLKEGITCPRKALIKSSGLVKLLKPLNPNTIMNVNTPEEAVIARNLITNNKLTT